MPSIPQTRAVYASINRPLTIGGADRRLFFVALMVGSGTFTLFGSLLTGALMFLALFLGARWTTQRDPQLLRIVLRSARSRRRYDPAKLEYIRLRTQNSVSTQRRSQPQRHGDTEQNHSVLGVSVSLWLVILSVLCHLRVGAARS
jgi:type IV secretory pathway TrbD component